MPSWDDWTRVCYHEAGHAVVSLALGYSPKTTVLRCPIVAGQLQAQGTYQLPTALIEDEQAVPIFDLVKRLAAGGVAEETRFGNYTYGVTGDHAKINMFLMMSRDAASTQERADNYPATRALLTTQWPAAIRIAEIMLRRFAAMPQLHDVEFPNTLVLGANAVNRIYQNALLSQQEHDDARLKAYYYSRARGNGEVPPFETSASQSDFEKASGDILGATP